jgi:hypothetical protein
MKLCVLEASSKGIRFREIHGLAETELRQVHSETLGGF